MMHWTLTLRTQSLTDLQTSSGDLRETSDPTEKRFLLTVWCHQFWWWRLLCSWFIRLNISLLYWEVMIGLTRENLTAPGLMSVKETNEDARRGSRDEDGNDGCILLIFELLNEYDDNCLGGWLSKAWVMQHVATKMIKKRLEADVEYRSRTFMIVVRLIFGEKSLLKLT